MKIQVYPDQKPEYVPDILFEDGTYKSKEDYISRMRKLDKRLRSEKKDTKNQKPG
jgi:hypothetical protein